MPCHRPIPATRSASGEITLRHSRHEAVWEDGQYLELPCGNCPSCRTKRVRSWAIRSHHEALSHTRLHAGHKVPNGCFLTLTYNDQSIPSDGSLCVRHWQLFAKAVRHHFGPIRYLHCGEYGENGTKRPHYHAALYGVDFHEDRKIFNQTPTSTIWTSQTLEDIWGRGFCTLAPLNFASAAYVAGYVFKKLKNAEFENQTHVYGAGKDPISGKKPEYITMSRNPGLGALWFKKHHADVYPHDFIRIGNKTFRPPAFYDELLRKRDPDMHEAVMAKRHAFLDEAGPSTDNLLRARHEIFSGKPTDKKERHSDATLFNS